MVVEKPYGFSWMFPSRRSSIQEILDIIRNPSPDEFQNPDILPAKYYLRREVAKYQCSYHVLVSSQVKDAPACPQSDKYILGYADTLSFAWLGFKIWILVMV